jgi:hypothetical protein
MRRRLSHIPRSELLTMLRSLVAILPRLNPISCPEVAVLDESYAGMERDRGLDGPVIAFSSSERSTRSIRCMAASLASVAPVAEAVGGILQYF